MKSARDTLPFLMQAVPTEKESKVNYGSSSILPRFCHIEEFLSCTVLPTVTETNVVVRLYAEATENRQPLYISRLSASFPRKTNCNGKLAELLAQYSASVQIPHRVPFKCLIQLTAADVVAIQCEKVYAACLHSAFIRRGLATSTH